MINETFNFIINTTQKATVPMFNECLNSANAYSKECLYKTLCPQFSSYFINYGIAIIIGYIIISWGLWWFFKHGYKKIDNINLNSLDTRIYWDTFIRHKLSLFMLGYISVVVYLSIKG